MQNARRWLRGGSLQDQIPYLALDLLEDLPLQNGCLVIPYTRPMTHSSVQLSQWGNSTTQQRVALQCDHALNAPHQPVVMATLSAGAPID